MSIAANVENMEITLLYLGETPVECLRIIKTDSTAVVVRPTRAQLAALADQIRVYLSMIEPKDDSQKH